jgi:hypothetical protein
MKNYKTSERRLRAIWRRLWEDNFEAGTGIKLYKIWSFEESECIEVSLGDPPLQFLMTEAETFS